MRRLRTRHEKGTEGGQKREHADDGMTAAPETLHLQVSLLKIPFGHGIGVSMKTMVADVRQSERARLCCDPISVRGF